MPASQSKTEDRVPSDHCEKNRSGRAAYEQGVGGTSAVYSACGRKMPSVSEQIGEITRKDEAIKSATIVMEERAGDWRDWSDSIWQWKEKYPQ
jgi:hypothetical protein